MMQELPLSTLIRAFLERYRQRLSIEQMEAIALWEKNLCELSAADREALTARFVRVQEAFAKFADEIVSFLSVFSDGKQGMTFVAAAIPHIISFFVSLF